MPQTEESFQHLMARHARRASRDLKAEIAAAWYDDLESGELSDDELLLESFFEDNLERC